MYHQALYITTLATVSPFLYFHSRHFADGYRPQCLFDALMSSLLAILVKKMRTSVNQININRV